jgi:hypothetical protein
MPPSNSSGRVRELTKRNLMKQLLVTALERSEKLNEMEIESEQLRQSALRFREQRLVCWTTSDGVS